MINFLTHLIPIAQAQTAEGFDLIGKIPCAGAGNCEIPQIINGFGILMNWAVSISGAIALLLFIVGGVYLLASAGRADWVKRGKDILVGTSTALFFIFSSWLIVNFIVTSLICLPNTNNNNTNQSPSQQPSSCRNSPFRLDAGIQTTTGDPNDPDIFCQQANREGVLCGGPTVKNSMKCHDNKCITNCQYQYQVSGNDFQCRPTSDCNFPAGGTCQNSNNCHVEANLCPPKSYFNDTSPREYVCCFPRE